MIIIFFYTALIVSVIGLIIATYTDIKERIVPNRLNYGLALVGLIIFGAQAYFESNPLPFLYSLFGMFFGFFFGWILWKLGVFAGGDIKLFMGLGALNPFTPALLKIGLLSNANIPLFPITLFVYSLLAFLPYGLFVIACRIIKNKKYQKELYNEMKPKVLLAIHASIFASATYAILIFLGISTLTTIIALIVWGLLKSKKKYITLICVIVALIFSSNLFINALITAIFVSVIAYTIIKLLFSTRKVLSKEIEVKKLEEGMIPSTSLYWKGKKVIEEKGINFELIIKCIKEKNSKPLTELLSHKKEIISARKARGLSEEELREIKKLAQKGLIPKKIRIKESMPFVPTMFLGYLLCLILGDFVILLFLGMI
jgi:archaeal preflagellin peptidase FlaK